MGVIGGDKMIVQLTQLAIILIFMIGIFMVGLRFEKWYSQIKQNKCNHDFKLYRVCNKCELRQRGEKQ